MSHPMTYEPISMKGLAFDPATHTYTLKGLPIPSVTQVIAGTQDFLGVADGVLEEARARGRRIHRVTAVYDAGLESPDAAGSEISPYLEAWIQFLSDTAFEPRLIEVPVYSKSYRFAGTVDRVGWLRGKLSILDIKTVVGPSRLHPAVGLQLAAYRQAYNETRPRRSSPAEERYAIQLRADGKYTLIQYADKADWSVFLACLTLYNWRKRYQ